MRWSSFSQKTPMAPALAVFTLYTMERLQLSLPARDSNIESPADLAGKTIAAPAFDTGYRAWGIFAEANDLEADAVEWQNVDPSLRETLLSRGDVDAITGFYFTSLLNLEERGMSEDELTIMPFPEYGVPLYGNAIIASDEFADEHPEAVQGFFAGV
ncbi:hypothetical protein HSBAA_62550 [Vreelandella sulfidaeris]|uniref:Thiamine pyrimidine synthase n=1 Tax=Vreelandella sulfidaeris TaxID=115553 RepID=A0A455UL25_9GAMM|nr:hypothetical protein HSBAA_62550 [Halomonas sulfidaeris]